MAEKTLKSRIVHKHDVESNWLLATNFTPKQGEIIVYDIDENYNYERFKIGDGVQNVNTLPFVNDALKSELVEQIGEVDEKVDAVSVLVGDTAVSTQITDALDSYEVSWNDLTDKPFYEEATEVNGDTITWDGNADGMTTVVVEALGGNSYAKISNVVITPDDCAGGGTMVCVHDDGSTYESDIIVGTMEIAPGFYIIGGKALSVSEEMVGQDFEGTVFSESGLWGQIGVQYTIQINGYNGFTTVDTVVKTIDEKFIPDTIARVEEVSIVNDRIDNLSYMQYKNNKITMPEPDSASTLWTNVIYGNGKFVAATDGDIFSNSEDGINWSRISMPGYNSVYHLACGNGKFIALLGGTNIAAYSEDGVNWTQTTLPISGMWNAITYGDDKFVALKWNDDIAAYSEDGINWIPTTLPASDEWESITYGDGKFVAIAANTKSIIYSENGINWTHKDNMPRNASWCSITYGNGKFVATADYGRTEDMGIVAYSEDGINWKEKDIFFPIMFPRIAYGDGKFLLVGANNDIGVYSEDGINWTQTTLPITNGCIAVTYGDGKFVLISKDGNVAISKDGKIWIDTYHAVYQDGVKLTEDQYIPDTIARKSDLQIIIEEQILPKQMKYECLKPTEFVQSNKSTRIVYGNDKFVAIPGTTGSGAAYSYNGTEWIDVALPGQGYSRLIYGDGMFAAYGSSGTMAYSYDGITWKEAAIKKNGSSTTSFGYNAVAYGNGRYIAVGNTNTAAYSEDGINWTTSSISFRRTNWTNIFYGGGKFIALDGSGANYALYTSDGITWNAATLPVGIRSNSCAYGDGKFVMFDLTRNSGVCSEDGINWTAMQVAGAPSNTSYIGWSNVVYGNGKFIAVDTNANSNTAVYSYDGINWTLTTMSGMNSPDSIAYGNGLFVAVCTSATSEASVVYSHDGIDWYSEGRSIKQDGEIVPVVFSVNGIKPDGSGDVLLNIEEFLPDNIARVEYVDEAIAAIPTPDVSGQIAEHNTSATAHEDIRADINSVSALVGDTAVSTQISNAIDGIEAISFDEIDEICGAKPFDYDESGNVSVLSAFKDSTISYDEDGNVVIA